MGVVLTGATLTLEQVLEVARGEPEVELEPAALERMRRAQAVAERALARGELVYGLSTGVGVRKRAQVGASAQAEFNSRLIVNHLVGQGDEAPEDVVRATLLVLANGFARGASLAGPALAQRVVDALNERRQLRVRRWARSARPISRRSPISPTTCSARRPTRTGGGSRAPRQQRLRDGLRRPGGRGSRNGCSRRPSWRARSISRRSPPTCLDPSGDRARAALSGVGHNTRAARRAPRRQQALRAGRRAQPPGSAHVPLPAPGARCRPRRPRLRARAARARAERRAGKPARRRRERADPLRRQLRLAAARDGARPAPNRARAGADERERADGQAPAGAAERAARGPLPAAREAPRTRSASTGPPARRSPPRRASSPSPSRSSSRARARGGDRGSDDDAPLAARRLAEMVALGERIVTIELLVACQAIDLREHRLGAGTRRAHELVRERVPFKARRTRSPRRWSRCGGSSARATWAR